MVGIPGAGQASGSPGVLAATTFAEIDSGELLEGLFRFSADGVILTRPDGAVVRVNPAACRALGYSEADAIALGRAGLVVDGPELRRLLAERAEKGVTGGVIHFRRADGSTFPAEITSAIIPVQGALAYAYTIFRDVTEREQAGRSLAESAALLRDVFDAIPDPLFLKDQASRWRLVNQATLRAVGKRLEEVIGRTDREIYADRDVGEALMEADRQVMSTGEARVIEESVLTPEGVRTFLSTKAPFRDTEGRVVGLIGHAKDVTGRKRAEELGALQAAISSLPIGVVVVEQPPGGMPTVVAINPAYQRIVSTPPRAGTPFSELPYQIFLPDRRTAVAPADWPGPRAARTGSPVHDVELHLRRGDGSWRILSVSAAPAGVGADGRSVRAVAVLLDVTEEWTAAAAVQASERKFHSLVEEAADAFFLHAFDGRILEVNRQACESLGYTRGELLQARLTDIEPALDLAGAQAEWSRIEPGRPFTLRGHHRRKDGTLFPVEVRFVRLEAEGERLFMGLARDITAQLEREAALLQSRRALRILVEANKAIVRARSEDELFREVCRATVEEGGFRMAWAGLAEAGQERAIRPVAWYGHEAGYLRKVRITWDDTERGRGTSGEAMRSGRVAVANDLATDPRFAPWREEALARGYAASASLPLVARGERLGVIGVLSERQGAFAPEVIEILQRVAEDLAFGVETLRARALAEAQSAQLQVAVEVAELGLWRADFVTGAVSGSEALRRMAGFAPGEPSDRNEHWMSRVHPEDLPVVARRLEEVLRARGGGGAQATSQWRFRYVRPDGSVVWVDARSRICFDDQGSPTVMYGANRDVTSEVLEREQLQALTSRSLSVREEEMARIARDLHDDLGQILTALQLELRGAEGVAEKLGTPALVGPLLDRLVAASELAGSTVRTVQRIAQDLHPEVLSLLGLESALRQELRRLGERSGLRTGLSVSGRLPTGDVATALFRIGQEALTNVARHAAASRVEVRLEATAAMVALEVRDDGCGLPAGGPVPGHLGLLGIRERARALGGDATFSNEASGGAVVRVGIPVRERRAS